MPRPKLWCPPYVRWPDEKKGPWYIEFTVEAGTWKCWGIEIQYSGKITPAKMEAVKDLPLQELLLEARRRWEDR